MTIKGHDYDAGIVRMRVRMTQRRLIVLMHTGGNSAGAFSPALSPDAPVLRCAGLPGAEGFWVCGV